MAGPVITAIQGQKRAREPNDAFSLALIATNVMGTPVQGTGAIWSSYVDDHQYTACHDIAAQLVDILQTVPGTAPAATGAGLAAVQVGQNNIGAGQFLKIDYGRHSFTLVNHAGQVECLEGWAGRPPFTIGSCLFDRADEILTTAAVAQAAFPDMLSMNQGTRRQAVDSISRAGLGGFGPINAVPALTISAYPLAAPGLIATRYRGLVNTAMEWAQAARENQRNRFTCSICLEYHGWTRSWFGNTWGRCSQPMCGKTFCPGCKLHQPQGQSAHLCTCGRSIDEVPWHQVRA